MLHNARNQMPMILLEYQCPVCEKILTVFLYAEITDTIVEKKLTAVCVILFHNTG